MSPVDAHELILLSSPQAEASLHGPVAVNLLVAEYIQKPYDIKDLEKRINKVLKKSC